MKLRLLVLAFLASSLGWGQVTIAGWEMNGLSAYGPSPFAATTTVANVTVGGLTRGSGVTTSGGAAGSAWGGNGFDSTTLAAAAVTAGDFFTFSVTPNTGFTLSLNSINPYNVRRSGTGPITGQWQYQVGAGAFTNIGTAITWGGTITAAGNAQLAIDLLSISALQNIAPGTTITIRCVLWGATDPGGTFYLNQFQAGNDFIVDGTVNPVGITTAQNGDWFTGSTWIGGVVPTSAQNVVVNHQVTANANITRNPGTQTTINAGARLAMNGATYTNSGTTTVNGTFELQNGSFADGNNFIYSGTTGTLTFNVGPSYNVANNHVYWPASNGPFNVNVTNGGFTLTSANRVINGTLTVASGVVTLNTSTLTLNGTCRINTGGFFANSPIFGAVSTLIYNSGGTFGRGNEWQATGVGTIGTTPGYPNNVQISSSTTLNYNNGTPLAKAIHGNLTIDAGSSFYMDFGGGASGGTLTVAGNISNAGNFSLGNNIGDDLRLGGNFTQTGAGTFNGNNRAIFFTRNGTQTVSSVTPLTIPYVVFNPASGSTIVQLLSNLTISAPEAGNAISFSSASDVLDLNSQTLTLGTAGVANTIAGVGTFRGTTSSNLTLLGTGSIGTLRFTTGQQILGNLTLNRQASVIGFTLGTTLSIDGVLSLSNGLVQLNNQTMIFTTSGSVVGNNSSNYIIADFDLGGRIQKTINSSSLSFTFPIGDDFGSSDGSQYSPATINFTGGTYSGASVTVSVRDLKHPNMDATSDYISRYWVITRAGTFTDPVYNFSGSYLPIDIIGTAGNSSSQQWDGSVWSVQGTNFLSANTVTMTGLTNLSATNHLTGGLRTPEIRVERSTNAEIPNGSVPSAGFDTVFAAQNIGGSGTKTYKIVNIGTADLNVSSITLGGSNPADFSVNAATPFVIAPGSFVTFTVTFAPTISGVLTAEVIIANNDVNESPYTFGVRGTGNCSASNSITPTSGPVGTEITINATVNNLEEATVTFNGIPAVSVTQVSTTQIKVIVPAGAISGTVTTTNLQGCSVSTPFTIIDNFTAGCEGGTSGTELFISEVTDATTGSLTYIEIYNPTANPIQLNQYSIRMFFNGNATAQNQHTLNDFVLNPGQVYVFAVGVVTSATPSNTCTITGGNGQLANQTSTAQGPNFADSGNNALGHDHIALFKNEIKIDSWGVYQNQSWAISLNLDGRGATFRRKNTVVAPNVNYSNSDWDIIDWEGSGQDSCSTNDYSDIGSYSFLAGNPPSITTHPVFTPSCLSTILTVVGLEGFTGGNPLVYQWFVALPNQLTWNTLTNGGVYSGVTTNVLAISDITGLEGYQYYCQVRENTATCFKASNAVQIRQPQTITWNGTTWTSGITPSFTTNVIFDADYDTALNGDVTACACHINFGKVVNIASEDYFDIFNGVTNSGTLNIANSGSLKQHNDLAVNSGTIKMTRTTRNMYRWDYVYWGSPIQESLMSQIPNAFDHRYRWMPGVGANWYVLDVITPGHGFITRVRNVFPFNNLAQLNRTLSYTFEGTPNNGLVPVNVAWMDNFETNFENYNLLANPYPSAISAESFLTQNSSAIDGTIYYWTSVSPYPGIGSYSTGDYAKWNLTGGVGTNATNDSPANTALKPDGQIVAGQGFFVRALANNAVVTFRNSQRLITPNTQFFRTAQPEVTHNSAATKHRYWLNLTSNNGHFNQMLVGYLAGATNGIDSAYDGFSVVNNPVNIYSIVDGKSLSIQGKALPFETTDVVSLGIRITTAGTYTIAIDELDGLFASDQAIYIEDFTTGVIHNLKIAPYTFTSVAGTFTTRFQIRYTNVTLGIDDVSVPSNSVWVYGTDVMTVVSSEEFLTTVVVHDLLGRRLYEVKNISASQHVIALKPAEQVLLVSITLANGQVETRKVKF